MNIPTVTQPSLLSLGGPSWRTQVLKATALKIIKTGMKTTPFDSIFSGDVGRWPSFIPDPDEAFKWLARSLAARCRKDKNLMWECIRQAPVMSLCLGVNVNYYVDEACKTVTKMAEFVPSGRKKTPLDVRIIRIISELKKAKRREIQRKVQNQSSPIQLTEVITKLITAGVIRRKPCEYDYFILTPDWELAWKTLKSAELPS